MACAFVRWLSQLSSLTLDCSLNLQEANVESTFVLSLSKYERTFYLTGATH